MREIYFRYDLGPMPLNKAGKIRKHHQFIGVFPTKKGTFDYKSTYQPKPPYSIKCPSKSNPILINDPRFTSVGILVQESKVNLAFIVECKGYYCYS